ncbi:unnamed protein product, partial [Ilex paraguariensis]
MAGHGGQGFGQGNAAGVLQCLHAVLRLFGGFGGLAVDVRLLPAVAVPAARPAPGRRHAGPGGACSPVAGGPRRLAGPCVCAGRPGLAVGAQGLMRDMWCGLARRVLQLPPGRQALHAAVPAPHIQAQLVSAAHAAAGVLVVGAAQRGEVGALGLGL